MRRRNFGTSGTLNRVFLLLTKCFCKLRFGGIQVPKFRNPLPQPLLLGGESGRRSPLDGRGVELHRFGGVEYGTLELVELTYMRFESDSLLCRRLLCVMSWNFGTLFYTVFGSSSKVPKWYNFRMEG